MHDSTGNTHKNANESEKERAPDFQVRLDALLGDPTYSTYFESLSWCNPRLADWTKPIYPMYNQAVNLMTQ